MRRIELPRPAGHAPDRGPARTDEARCGATSARAGRRGEGVDLVLAVGAGLRPDGMTAPDGGCAARGLCRDSRRLDLAGPGRASRVLASRKRYAPVAQRIEHLTTDQKVGGSNPFWRTNAPPSAALVGSGALSIPAPRGRAGSGRHPAWPGTASSGAARGSGGPGRRTLAGYRRERGALGGVSGSVGAPPARPAAVAVGPAILGGWSSSTA